MQNHQEFSWGEARGTEYWRQRAMTFLASRHNDQTRPILRRRLPFLLPITSPTAAAANGHQLLSDCTTE